MHAAHYDVWWSLYTIKLSSIVSIFFILTDIVEARQIKITSNNEDAVRIIASQLKSGASLSVTVEGGPTASIQITRGMRFTKMRGMRSDSTVYMSEDHHLWCSLGGQRPNNLRCFFYRQMGVEQCKGTLFLPHIICLMSKLVMVSIHCLVVQCDLYFWLKKRRNC